jgi:hypothetical protein
MPLAGTGAVLGAAFALAGGCNPLGALAANGMAAAMASWIVSNAKTLPGAMTGSGGSVTGHGAITFTGSSASFGAALAAGIPAVDPASITKWTTIGNAVMNHMMTFGSINPGGFSYSTSTGGPVTGVGTVIFSSLVMVPLLSSAMGFADAANILTWLAISNAILGHIAANGAALSLGFTCAAGGGPLVGFSTIG